MNNILGYITPPELSSQGFYHKCLLYSEYKRASPLRQEAEKKLSYYIFQGRILFLKDIAFLLPQHILE